VESQGGRQPERSAKIVRRAVLVAPLELADVAGSRVSCAACSRVLVVVGDVPGAEVVADGVDPRLGVLLDAVDDKPPRVERVFIYQQDVERSASGMVGIEEDLATSLERVLAAVFPSLEPAPKPHAE